MKTQSNIKSWFNAFIVLIIGLSLFTFPIIGFDFAFFPGDLGDARLNLYFLEHNYQFALGNLSSYWDAPFMYPEKKVLTYSDNLMGSSPIYILFRILGYDIYNSYQCWFVAICVLNFICAYLFLRKLFCNDTAALLGAFVFAFSIALQSQLTHSQTFPRFAIPLAFLFAQKFAQSSKPIHFTISIFLVVYQFYCGIYLGLLLAVPLAIYMFMIFMDLIFTKSFKLNLRWVIQILAGLLINLAFIFILMFPYMERKIIPSAEHYSQILTTVPTILSYLFSQQGSLLWDKFSEMAVSYPAFWDHQIFTGLLATLSFISLAITVVRLFILRKLFANDKINYYLVFFAGFISFLLFLRFGDKSLYYFIYHFPGYSSMRSLTRVINVQLLFFATAVSWTYIIAEKRFSQFKTLLFLVFLLLLICDNYFYTSKSSRTTLSEARTRINKIEPAYKIIPKGSIVSFEPDTMISNCIEYQLDGMLMAQKYGLISINGYSAICPGEFGFYWQKPNEESRKRWLGNFNFLKGKEIYVIKSRKKVDKIKL